MIIRIEILTPDDLLKLNTNEPLEDISMLSFGRPNPSNVDLVVYLYATNAYKVIINRTGICTTSHFISQKEFESLVSLWIVKKTREFTEAQQIAKRKAAVDKLRELAAEYDIEIIIPTPIRSLDDLDISDEHTKETNKPIFIRQTKAREIPEDIEKFITFIQTENISKTAREMIRDILEK